MKKYKIIFIICFLIVLGLMIYTFLPKAKVIVNTFGENKEGSKGVSQNDLRASNIGEAYISDEIKEHNKNVKHSEDNDVINHSGDMGDTKYEAYATPIYGGDEVAKHFTNSSNYYIGEVKLEEAFYNYIPELCNTTANMTNSQLRSYFDSNSDVIETRLGIVSADEFVKFIGSMDRLNGKKYVKIDIPSNAVTENYTNMSINFLIELTLEDGTKSSPISITISHLKSSVNQSAPYIQFVGLYKSKRAE